MGRIKSNKEYCLAITIDGEEFYTYAYDEPWRQNKYIVRLTKNAKRARKIKTLKILDCELREIHFKSNLEFKLGRKVLAKSGDVSSMRLVFLEKKYEQEKNLFNDSLEKIEKLKKKLFKPDSEFYNSLLNEIKDSINGMRSIVYSLPRQHQQIRNLKKQIEANPNTKKVEIKILDASHNFRYSKLKKLIQENEN